MKHDRLILFVSALSILLATGCTDLEENVLDEQLGEDLPTNPGNAEALINAPYAGLRRTIEWFDYWGLQEVTTDEVIVPTRGTDWYDNGAWIDLHLHTWTPDHIRMKNVWDAFSQTIAWCNTAMYYIEQFPQTDKTEQYINEARFLRAYYMYLVNDLYGQVPYREASEQDYTISPRVMNRKEAAEFIIAEIEATMPELKTKAEVGSERVTVEAAHALLAKIYLNYEVYTGEAKWADAISHCNELINSGTFTVTDDYWTMFQKDVAEHSEFILRVPMDDNVDMGSGSVWVNFTLHYSQVFGNITSTWNGPSTTKTFFDTWDKVNDVRFFDDRIKSQTGFNQGFLHGQQYGLNGAALKQRNGQPLIFVPEINLKSAPENAGIRVVKFAPNPETQRQFSSPNDVPVMRISDIYLIRAEAKFRSNDVAGALADINFIRSKRSAAGKMLPALTSLTEADILKERGFELYWEGLRRQDLIRFGKFTEAYQEKPVTDASRQLFPLPTSATDVNENLIQNPGY